MEGATVARVRSSTSLVYLRNHVHQIFNEKASRLTRSDPARSTRYNCEILVVLVAASREWIETIKIACERELQYRYVYNTKHRTSEPRLVALSFGHLSIFGSLNDIWSS